MKLIVGGSTGFMAKELARQALSHPKVDSIVLLGQRTSDDLPRDAKLKQVVCSDFEVWPADVIKEVAEADACIWTIRVTPSTMKIVTFDQAVKVNRDYALTAIQTISLLPRTSSSPPRRFIYVSDAGAMRDPSQKPRILGDYRVMQGEAEARILKCAKHSAGAVEACIARPGVIEEPGNFGFRMATLCWLISPPRVHNTEISATLLGQSVDGFEKETLDNQDLVRIGRRELAARKAR